MSDLRKIEKLKSDSNNDNFLKADLKADFEKKNVTLKITFFIIVKVIYLLSK